MSVNAGLRIHLGCGKRYLKGFYHIDIEADEHIDALSTLDRLDFLENESVSEIYCAHSLEYYNREEVINVFSEWNRVLAPSGKIYVSVPNFDSLIKIYVESGKLENILGPLFGKWQTNNGFIYHKTVWNHSNLETALLNSGFVNVCEFSAEEYLHGIDRNYDDYSLAYFPHLDSKGIRVSLNLRAEKGR